MLPSSLEGLNAPAGSLGGESRDTLKAGGEVHELEVADRSRPNGQSLDRSSQIMSGRQGQREAPE